ncbi:hypothetical protein J1N35_034842 [Gossypium stocksii]|uniref:Uncharacterized protein n=1 Tax=Gossypium stocksii TaxID=47602 RepID=A0A9D3USU2_9ROSI|nr:hypothetical protein J1N35_034842 [Gossypium stocksii]
MLSCMVDWLMGIARKVFEISSFTILLSTALEIIPSLFSVQIHAYNKEWMISKALDSFIMMRKQGTEFNFVMYGGNIAIYGMVVDEKSSSPVVDWLIHIARMLLAILLSTASETIPSLLDLWNLYGFGLALLCSLIEDCRLIFSLAYT